LCRICGFFKLIAILLYKWVGRQRSSSDFVSRIQDITTENTFLKDQWTMPVDHASRSCVISLESLEESGLYDLYPEFARGTGHGEMDEPCARTAGGLVHRATNDPSRGSACVSRGKEMFQYLRNTSYDVNTPNIQSSQNKR